MSKQPSARLHARKRGWRETAILLNEFQRPVSIFVIASLGLGSVYHFLSRMAGEPLDNLPEVVFLRLPLAFLQPSGYFPDSAVLQSFFFLPVVIGVVTLAQGLVEIGVRLFNRRASGKEWKMAVASPFSNHTTMAGLGHPG